MAKKNKKRMKPRIMLPRIAPFDFEVSYKNYEELGKLVNDRARIIGKKRSGLSAKEQRLVSREVKRARHLGLLPFKSNL
jgi:small subunit ribosomal protein S18